MTGMDKSIMSVRSGLETGFIVNDERVVFEGQDEAQFTVIEADVSMLGGNEQSIDGAEAANHMPILFAQVKGGMPGVVCVAEHDGKLLLVRHWRFATDSYEWEFPRSMGVEGLTAGATAEAELMKEAGVRAVSYRMLQSVHADSCKLRDSIAVVALTMSDDTADAAETVDSRLVWLTPEEIDDMIAEGNIMDCITLSAYLIWKTQQLTVEE